MRAEPETAAREAPSKSEPDDVLVARCLEGDQRAWSALIAKYKELVWSVPLRYRMPPEDCADIFQAVWMDLFADLKSLRQVKALRSWLITTAAHKCYHWKRRQQAGHPQIAALPEWDPEDSNPSFLQLKLQFEREQMLRDAMAVLPERCRKMIAMLFFEEPARSYDEVAKNLGLATGSIGFIRGRCLKKLRDALEGMNF
jgi:RNA polymerase sigma factor (sigma-70 family)